MAREHLIVIAIVVAAVLLAVADLARIGSGAEVEPAARQNVAAHFTPEP